MQQSFRNPFFLLSILLFYALIQCFDVPDHLETENPVLGPAAAAQNTRKSGAAGGVLQRLLKEAKISSLSKQEIDVLEGKIQDLYGVSPIIAGMEHCEAYRKLVDVDLRQLAVAGMFNTGTNLLDNQLRKNIQGLKLKSIWQVPWGKHRMEKVKWTHVAPKMEAHDKNNILPIVVIRHPIAWLQSMCAHPYAAHWKHDQAHCPNFVPNEIDRAKFPRAESFSVTVKFDETDIVSFDSLIHLWSEWYRQYLEANYPLLIVRYEDLVFQPHMVLNEIASCVGATVRIPLEYQTKTSKAHGSGTDLVKGIQKTATLKNTLDSADYGYFQQNVDEDLLQIFRYKV